MIEKSCTEFTDMLSAHSPVPGGGGAAALCGALAASLGCMVANYSMGKKKTPDELENMQVLLNKLTDLRYELLHQVEEDAAAFEPLAKAYKLPKDSPAYIETMEKASKNACIAPINMIKYSYNVLKLLWEMFPGSNKMLITDIGCSAIMANAAIESAALNVTINTKDMIDRAWAEMQDTFISSSISDAKTLSAQILTEVYRILQQ